MIHEVLDVIFKDLNHYFARRLGVQEPKVVVNNLLSEAGKTPPANQNKLVVSLVNLTTDTFLSTNPSPGGFMKKNPPVGVNLEVLIASFFDDYQEGLKFLWLAISYFQGKAIFTRENTPGLSPGTGRVIVESVHLSRSDNYQLWRTTGTHYRPSIVYKIRFQSVEDVLSEELPTITAVTTDKPSL